MTRALRKLALALGVLGLALLAANAAVARWYPLGGLLYALDAERLHVTVPGARRLQLMPERTGNPRVLVELNSLGLRGPELRAAERTCLVVGDSLVLAANVALGDTFPVHLEQHLAEAGQDWQVLNAGLESYGPDQTLLQLGELLPALRPDQVVLVLCAHNDFGDLHRNKLFALDPEGRPEGLPVPQPVVLGDQLRALFAYREREAAQPALLRAWRALRRRNSETGLTDGRPTDFIADYLLAARYQHQDAVLQRSPVVDDIERDTWDADVALHPDWPSAKHKVALMTQVLRAIAARCEAAEVPLLALVVPSAVDLDPGFAIQVDRSRYPGYDPLRLSHTLATCAREAGLETVDLTALFASSQPETLFVGEYDFHWMPRAQDLAARVVAPALATGGE